VIKKNIIISIILLLTYSLGFAHNFIPHNHDIGTEVHEHSHENEEHKHHHHASEEKSHNDDISHGDHFDEGFYDLILCFLHDANHHEDECDNHYYIPAKSNNSLSKKSNQLKLAATLLASTINIKQPELISNLDFNSNLFYHSHKIEGSPLRGPPSPKC